MSDKNLFKPSGWRGRLEALDEIQGEPAFNKNAAWDKLSARMEEPAKKSNKFIWWFAAAAVIAGLSITAIQTKAPDAEQVQQKAHHIKRARPDSLPVLSVAANSIENISNKSAVPIQRKRTIPDRKPESVLPSFAESDQKAFTAVNPVPINLLSLPVVEDSKDTLRLVTTPPQFQKKKMAVVYLHEIESVPTDLLTKRLAPKKKFTRYQKYVQTGSDDVFVATEPKRFTINLSSAN